MPQSFANLSCVTPATPRAHRTRSANEVFVMADNLTPARPACKRKVSTLVCKRYDPEMSSENEVWRRIEQIMKSRGWRQEDLCRATGVPNATLSVFKKRATESPDASLSIDTATKIATGSGVSVDWLMNGTGSSGMMHVEPDDPYPSRAVVLAMAMEEKDVPPSAVAMLKADRFADGDPGEDFWHRRLLEHVRRARAFRHELREELADDDTFGND